MIAVTFFEMGGQPILNVLGSQAFLVSFFVATIGALLAFPVRQAPSEGQEGDVGRGDARVRCTRFGLMVVAFGICPDRWIAHADAELGWGTTNIVYGPFDILKPTAIGGSFTRSPSRGRRSATSASSSSTSWFFGLLIYIWGRWQKRGEAPVGTAVATSNYGRPLVKKA